jgi:hypothetical protein
MKNDNIMSIWNIRFDIDKFQSLIHDIYVVMCSKCCKCIEICNILICTSSECLNSCILLYVHNETYSHFHKLVMTWLWVVW